MPGARHLRIQLKAQLQIPVTAMLGLRFSHHFLEAPAQLKTQLQIAVLPYMLKVPRVNLIQLVELQLTVIPKFFPHILHFQLARRQLQKERNQVLNPMYVFAQSLIVPLPVSLLPVLVN